MFVRNEHTVLKIVVGASMCLSSGFSGMAGCKDKTTNPKTNITRVEQEHGDGVLLPVLRPRVEPPLDPTQPPRSVVTPVHNPGQVTTQRNRQRRGDRQDQEGKKPDLELKHRQAPFAWRNGSEPLRPHQCGKQVNQQQHRYYGGQPGQNTHVSSFHTLSQAGTQANSKANVASPKRNMAGSQNVRSIVMLLLDELTTHELLTGSLPAMREASGAAFVAGCEVWTYRSRKLVAVRTETRCRTTGHQSRAPVTTAASMQTPCSCSGQVAR